MSSRPRKSFIPRLKEMIKDSEKKLEQYEDAQKREALNKAKQWLTNEKK